MFSWLSEAPAPCISQVVVLWPKIDNFLFLLLFKTLVHNCYSVYTMIHHPRSSYSAIEIFYIAS